MLIIEMLGKKIIIYKSVIPKLYANERKMIPKMVI